MSSPAPGLLRRFEAEPDCSFSREELQELRDLAGSNTRAAKIVALHCFKAGDFAGCVEFAELVLKQESSEENLVNLVVGLRAAGLLAKAISSLRDHAALLRPVTFHDLMCSCLTRLGEIEEAVKHGDQALKLKNDACKSVKRTASFVVRPFDIQAAKKNVIAFSVFGSNSRYLIGAVNNACVARYLYPGWTARFYTDSSTPSDFQKALRQNAAEVVLVSDLDASRYGLFWRFLVEDDENVDVYLVRDADSVLNSKERSAVAGWLKSGKPFHIMRDHPQHSELMLAGMWGAHRGNIGNMRKRITTFVERLPKRANYVHKDQHFLREEIWPIVRQSVHSTDSHFNFMSPQRFDPDYALPKGRHVGQDDWIFYTKN